MLFKASLLSFLLLAASAVSGTAATTDTHHTKTNGHHHTSGVRHIHTPTFHHLNATGVYHTHAHNNTRTHAPTHTEKCTKSHVTTVSGHHPCHPIGACPDIICPPGHKTTEPPYLTIGHSDKHCTKIYTVAKPCPTCPCK